MPFYTNRNREKLSYEENGNGRPLVFVHGWCMSSAVWKFQMEGLHDLFRVIAPDLRGHGSSLESTGGIDFDTFANDLVDLFESLDLRAALLVGWSMGAQIVLQANARLRERVSGVVLVAATPRFTATEGFSYALSPHEAAGMGLKVRRNMMRAIEGFNRRLFADGELEGQEEKGAITRILSSIPLLDSTEALDALDALIHADMRGLLAHIDTPTLILNGSNDRICLPEASTYLLRNIAGSRQIVFAGCGHVPFLTRSDRFNDTIKQFATEV